MSESKVPKYQYPSSETGGVKAFAIRGLFDDERYRMSEEYTDEERSWRKQWLKDQYLSPSEPRHVPELEIAIRNPIRRFFSFPWKYMESKMTPVVGPSFAQGFRFFVPKLIVTTIVVYASYYHLKYNQNDWTSNCGWQVNSSKPIIYPGDKGFPFKRDRFEPNDYDDRGFKARKVCRDP